MSKEEEGQLPFYFIFKGGGGVRCRFSAKSEIINPGNKSFVDPGPALCFELTAGERDDGHGEETQIKH